MLLSFSMRFHTRKKKKEKGFNWIFSYPSSIILVKFLPKERSSFEDKTLKKPKREWRKRKTNEILSMISSFKFSTNPNNTIDFTLHIKLIHPINTNIIIALLHFGHGPPQKKKKQLLSERLSLIQTFSNK